MAKDCIVRLNVSFLCAEEQICGEECRGCGEAIYGKGFRLIMFTNVNDNPIPRIHECDSCFCESCEDTFKI